MDMEQEIQNIVDEINAQGYHAICFWLPAKNVGGGPYYIFLLVSYLIEHTDLEIYYMDYADGYAHSLFESEQRVNFLDYTESIRAFPLDEPMIIFTNSTRVIQLPNMDPRNKLLFWHYETVPCAWDHVLLNRESKKFLQLTQRENAMVFHDWSSRNILNWQYHSNFNRKDYLPVFLPEKNVFAQAAPIEPGVITLGWLGRLGTEKVCSLYNIIDNFAHYKTTLKKRLIIIGDGFNRHDVETYCAAFKDDIDILFTGTIPKDQLDEFLINNIDILFAMGASVLEGAALKIPTVIVQLSLEPFDDDEFIWFFDSLEYCVGIMTTQKMSFPVTYTSFTNIICAVYECGEKRSLGTKCYTHFKQYHNDFDHIALGFLTFCQQSSLTFEKVKKCIKYTPYSTMKITQYQCHHIPLWSIIKHGNEKTYKLFGLTLLTLRWVGNDKIYIPFGIRSVMHRFTMSGYRFPTAQFHDEKSKISAVDLKNVMRTQKQRHKAQLLKKAQAGEKIKVCLFVSRISCWNFDELYKLLEASPYFTPMVVIKPFMYQGKEAMRDYMETAYAGIKAKGYRVLKGYDTQTDTFLDLKGTYDPDVLFYTKYWKPQFHENFYITNFLDRITFYTSYCFDIAHQPEVMNFELTNVVDRYFMPTEIHKQMAQEVMDNGGANVYVTGAPKLDQLMRPDYQAADVWKPQSSRKKRVIWAPHHSDDFPDNLYQFNAFFQLSQFMLSTARTYRDKIQFAFKPHPMLKPKLDNKWGKEVADAYYRQWAELENGQLETGEFVDLFRTSDAMILDSISFIAEYTAVDKPALFTICETTRLKLNTFGKMNFEVLYHTGTDLKEDIIYFLENNVLKEIDPKKAERETFIAEHLTQPNGKSASQNIYDCMYEEIFGRAGDKQK